MLLAIGDPAPDLAYGSEGGEAHLSELWADHPALVIWARHTG